MSELVFWPSDGHNGLVFAWVDRRDVAEPRGSVER